MRHWFCPLPLSPALVGLLSEAGLEAWPGGQTSSPDADCLLLYDQPDRSILVAAAADAVLGLQQIAEGYKQLLACANATGQPLLAAWRLERLDAATLQQWLKAGSSPATATVQPAAAIPPLQAAAILGLLEAQPELLDAYNDLELRAELLGDEPDLHQRQRLRQACGQGDELLQALLQTMQTPTVVRDLEQQLAAKDGELKEAREEAELTLLQLHQVQAEREAVFLADREKQQQLEARTGELKQITSAMEGMRQQLEPRVAELEEQLAAKDGELRELREVREEAELTLLQLHQAQEELEHYFLLSREQHQLLNKYGAQQPRVQKLIAQLTLAC